MSQDGQIDYSKIVFSQYDPEKVTDTEKFEFGARSETTFTGNLLRGLQAGYQSLTNPDLKFKDALSSIESDRQRQIFEEMPRFYGIRSDQEDSTILGGRLVTAFADPITWALPWTKVAAGGKAVSALMGAGVAAADSATRDYVQNGEVSGFNTGVSAAVGGTAGALSGYLARNLRFADDLESSKLEKRLQPEEPLSAQELSDIESSASRLISDDVVLKHTQDKPMMAINTQPMRELRKSIKALKKKKNKVSKSQRQEINFRITELEEQLTATRENYFRDQLELSLDKQDINIAMLEDLSKQKKLSDGILSKVVYETTRPVVGGIGGFALSGVVGDEDSDGLTMALMGAGVTSGLLYNKMRKSALTSVEKETGLLKINEAAGRNLQTSWKYLTAGTLSSRLDAMGGYAKIVGNMLFQRQNAPTDAVEARAIRESRKFNTTVNSILGDSFDDMTVRKLAGQIINEFNVDDIRVGYTGVNGALKPVTAEQIREARRVAPLLIEQQNNLAKSLRDTGLNFREIDQYGMAQVYDINFIRKNQDDFELAVREAMELQHPNLSGPALTKKADEFRNIMLGVERYNETPKYTPDNVFNERGEFRPLLDHFEKHRMITNFEARKLLAERGFMQMDVSEALASYSDRSIKAREFASSFGAKGEFLTEVFSKLNDSFVGKGKMEGFGNQYKKEILNAVDAYWGAYGSGSANKVGSSVMATLTTAANTTFLTRVGIASLGDMIQPFQNSGFYTASKAIMKKVGPNPSFSSQARFQYDNSFEREFTALMAQGGDPLNSYQYGLNWINKKFFKLVQLERITNAARGFAYDTGVIRAFDLSKKRSLSKTRSKEASTIGLTSQDIDVLKQFKNVQDAYDDDIGREILDRIGQKVADRDAILPMVGNRLLFTQTGNPYIRSFGQFLSWAQAKTSQINSLVERVEDGDAALALRALGLTSVYGGVQILRELSSPYYDPKEDQIDLEAEDMTNLAKRSLLLSGNYAPWQADKLVNVANSLVTRGKLLDEATPSLSYALDFSRSLAKITGNAMAGDTEGIVVNVADVTPFGKEALSYGERFNLINELKDRPNKAKGGVIEDVPNVPREPDERIDKMTGEPYDQQAGTAFVDEEDPLRRLGFGIGSLVARQVSKAVRNVETPPVKTDKQLEADFNDLTQAIAKGETPKMFEKPIDVPKASTASVANVDDTITPYKEIPVPASFDEMFKALSSDKKKKINVEIPDGRQVGIRLDIPAYLRKKDNAWVPTIHDETQGGVTSHRGTVSITNVDLTMSPSKQKASLDIREGDKMKAEIDRLAKEGTLRTGFRTGDMSKGKLIDANTPEGKKQIAALKKQYDKKPFARIGGNLVNRTDKENYRLAQQYIDDPEWTQVGFNPMKHSYFFDRKTGDPVTGGEEAIQVGPLVLVKNAVKGERKDFLFSQGGRVLKALTRR